MTTAVQKINSEALLDDRYLRDRYANKLEALERVGKLTLLPDGFHSTKKMVANLFEVDVDVISKVVQRNREELLSDGMKTLSGSELELFVKDMMSLSNDVNIFSKKFRFLSVFPRRAVLRIGMLLRDSEVAKALRSYLLNVEEIAREETPHVINKAIENEIYKQYPNTPRTYAEALRMLANSHEENERLKVEVQTLAPKAEKYDEFQNSNGYEYIGDVAKVLNIPGMGRTKLFEFLREQRVLVKDWEDRNIPTQRYMKSGYFYVVFREVTVYNRCIKEARTKKTATTFVTPKGIEFIRDLLLKHGYKSAKKVG